MSGLFGWSPGGRHQTECLMTIGGLLLEALAARGPDERGLALFGLEGLVGTEKGFERSENRPFFLLGQTRLSATDFGAAEHQPRLDPTGRYALAYDGQIRNCPELKRELEAQGWNTGDPADDEIILQALINWGAEALIRFEGQFALIFYDNRERSLLCARDHFGLKPLYYHVQDGSVALASELPALLLFPGVERRLNWRTAVNYLARWQTDVSPQSMVAGVNHLPAGHFLKIDLKNPQLAVPKPFWALKPGPTLKISMPEAAEELRRLLFKILRPYLNESPPWGVALSGGLDSTAILSSLRRLRPEPFPIKAFSFIGYGHNQKGLSIDESAWIDLAGNQARAEVYRINAAADSDLLGDLQRLVRAQGEPFASTSIYAQFLIFQEARRQGTAVVLDGQGADEILGGYDGFLVERLRTLWRRGQLGRAYKASRSESRWPGRISDYNGGKFFFEFLKAGVKSFLPRCEALDTPLPQWLNLAEVRSRNADRPFSGSLEEGPEYLRARLAEAVQWRSLPNYVRHADRSSMFFSVESRSPFCSRELAEFALSLPEHYLVTNEGQTKAVLREAMRGLAPAAILERRDKIGFATPEKSWLLDRAVLVEEILGQAAGSPLLNEKIMLKDWRAVQSAPQTYGHRLWRWVNYLTWKKIFNITE